MEFWNKIYSLPNPVLRANCLSRLTFWWINGLFKKGYDRRLEPDDMFEVLPEDSAENLANGLERKWKEEVENTGKSARKPCLRRAVMRCFKVKLIVAGFYCFLNESMRTAQPIFLLYLLAYFTPNSTVTKKEAYLFATGICMTALISVVLHQLYFFDVRRLGMQIRIAVIGLIYRKVLQLTQVTQSFVSTGQIINLVSNDVQKLDESFVMFHFIWVAPLQLLGTVYLLWTLLGPPCLVGLALLLLTIPMQAWFGRMFGRLRGKTAGITDERCRYMNEVISGMRVIKMYTWEQPFSKLVHELRKREISKVKKSSYMKAVNNALGFVTQSIISFFTFMTYVLVGNTLSAGVVFTSVALLSVVQRSMTKHFPLAVQFLSEADVSLRRAQDFLEHEELGADRVITSDSDTKSGDCSIIVNNLTASWDSGNGLSTLGNINFEVQKGDLLMVVGAVGSGKSTLLMSLMGELPVSKGSVQVKGTLGYVSQQPWIFSGSVKQNILFGQSFDAERYDSVIRACALEKDLDLLPEGDLTLVGERGLSISGGQKTRINLARAVYYRADIYLLDDPLSAVDARVGRHLFDECICGIIGHCPKVLVTHQLQYLRSAQEILCLQEGRVVGQGSYKELMTSGINFASLVLAKDHDDDADSAIDDDTDLTPLNPALVKLDPIRQSKPNRWSIRSSRSFSSTADILADQGSMNAGSVDDIEDLQNLNIEAEERPRGGIPFSLYADYFAAGSHCLVLTAMVVLIIAAQAAFTMCDWWLAHWSDEEARRSAVKAKANMSSTSSQNYSSGITSVPGIDRHYYIAVYGGLCMVTLALAMVRALVFFTVTVNSSKNLHNRMFDAILRTRIYFFDTNPLGRILNRFTKDVGFMDELLPNTFFDFVQMAILCGAVVIVNVGTMPWVLIGAVPLLIIFLFLRNYYLHTAREVKRLEAIGRSPVFSHFSATLLGLPTIRAFGAQSLVTDGFNLCQDHHTEAWFLFLCTSRWLAYRLDIMCLLFVTMASFTPLFISEHKAMEAGEVGLSISYAILLTANFQWCVRQSAEVENQMTSVERVISYTKLEPEGEWHEDVPDLPSSWPVHGLLTAEGVSLQYHPSRPRVLRNVYFCVRPKEKVGIVGRTGAGKSSLISAIFRLAEPKGTIRIDGIDVSTLELQQLRSKISIIPQDPVLFSGALRKNLDPFNEFLDCELWNSLQEVQLKYMIRGLPGQLEANVSESGSNFSVGQRQLICLARALLRRNKILIIDEATANVDFATDSLIQQTLRLKFQHCTVLTIAHRLSTVMDSDRIMVLDSGRLREFDEPYELLQNKQSWFYKLVEQTGRNSALQLREAARRAHMNRSRPRIEDSIPENERSGLHAYLPSSNCLALQVVTSL